MKYRCILFDLDHTLWDFETNSTETLRELYDQYQLMERGITSLPHFIETFVEVNTNLWDQYDSGKISREKIRFERFDGILKKLGVDDFDLSLKLSDEYVMQAPKKNALMPNALETLAYLHERYALTIITNGFEEIQATKLSSSGIHQYFKSVVTSARAGHKKPAKEIFNFALAEIGFSPDEAIMIGDNLATDIGGARNASVDTVFFNPHKKAHQDQPSYEIHDLKELMSIL